MKDNSEVTAVTAPPPKNIKTIKDNIDVIAVTAPPDATAVTAPPSKDNLPSEDKAPTTAPSVLTYDDLTAAKPRQKVRPAIGQDKNNSQTNNKIRFSATDIRYRSVEVATVPRTKTKTGKDKQTSTTKTKDTQYSRGGSASR